MNTAEKWHGTTIVLLRKNNETIVAGDGQVSLGNTVLKSNAKKVKPLPLDLPDELLGNLKRLGELVMKQLNDVLDSYVNKNFDKAKEVWEKDEQVDDLTYIAMESVIDFLSKDKKNLDFSTHLIFATKNLERAGDHITNIAETVCYLVKGEYLKGSRPKGKVIQE